MPCNFNHRALAAKVKEGDQRRRRHADGVQHDRDLRRHHDGHLGHEDQPGQPRGDRRLDRARRPRPPVRRRGRALRLRQDDPRHRDGARAARPPEPDALRRLDPARPLQRQGRHDPGGLRGDRRPRRRQDHRGGAATSSRTSQVPGAGACGGQFTANTMAMAFQMLGISPMGPSDIPAQDQTKAQAAYDAGNLVMDVLARGQRPSDIITRDALENAIAAVAMSGGSTNAVLHLLAVAREAGIELSIDDFDRIASQTPLLCDLKPGGRYVATDMHAAGGTALVAARLLEAGLLHEDAATVTAPRSASSRDRPARLRASRSSARSATRSSRPAASRSCAATSPPRARWSSCPATSASTTRARRACSTARRRRWRPSPGGRSTRATSSSSATRAPPAAPACARCWP